MFEDMPHNLEAPHALGMTTVLVRSEANDDHPVQKQIRAWIEPPEHVHHMTVRPGGVLGCGSARMGSDPTRQAGTRPRPDMGSDPKSTEGIRPHDRCPHCPPQPLTDPSPPGPSPTACASATCT